VVEIEQDGHVIRVIADWPAIAWEVALQVAAEMVEDW
jgi:hypothetical protein